MVAMQLLASVAAAAASGKLRGASLIQLLHDRCARTAGDATARRLLQRLLEAACVPYFRHDYRALNACLCIEAGMTHSGWGCGGKGGEGVSVCHCLVSQR